MRSSTRQGQGQGQADERTPLIPPSSSSSSSSSASIHKVDSGDQVDIDVKQEDVDKRAALRRVLFVALVSATSFAFTQTSLIYAFRVMTCDDYYASHSSLANPSIESMRGGGEDVHGWVEQDRCSVPAVESSTAKAIALMSTNTTFCSILNLFVTGWWIRRLGIRTAMSQQTFWASLRSLVQIHALSVGGTYGISVITITQAINVLGSGGGYELASMAYIAELCAAEERTGMFGVLMGFRMAGAALGYILGGLAFDHGGLLLPFQIAFGLLVFTTVFGSLFLPYIPPVAAAADDNDDDRRPQGDKHKSFLAPLKIFLPKRRPLYPSSSSSSASAAAFACGSGPGSGSGWDLNLTLLGVGAFFSVLATGYVGMGLQLVATNVFGFKPGPSGLMLSLNLAMRAFFLSILFPRIIASGRRYFASTSASATLPDSPEPVPVGAPALGAASSTNAALVPTPPGSPAPPTPASAPASQSQSHFDLFFLQGSILLDGVLTALVTFADRGWEMYLAAAVLPFASGTGSAVKGVVMDLVDEADKADALSAIALVEKLAQVSTISLFGFVFSALSEIGRPTAVFLANGAIALVGFMLLLFVRIPRPTPIAPA